MDAAVNGLALQNYERDTGIKDIIAQARIRDLEALRTRAKDLQSGEHIADKIWDPIQLSDSTTTATTATATATAATTADIESTLRSFLDSPDVPCHNPLFDVPGMYIQFKLLHTLLLT